MFSIPSPRIGPFCILFLFLERLVQLLVAVVPHKSVKRIALLALGHPRGGGGGHAERRDLASTLPRCDSTGEGQSGDGDEGFISTTMRHSMLLRHEQQEGPQQISYLPTHSQPPLQPVCQSVWPSSCSSAHIESAAALWSGPRPTGQERVFARLTGYGPRRPHSGLSPAGSLAFLSPRTEYAASRCRSRPGICRGIGYGNRTPRKGSSHGTIDHFLKLGVERIHKQRQRSATVWI